MRTNNPHGEIRNTVAHTISENAKQAALRVSSHASFKFDSLDSLKRILMSLVKKTSSAEALATALHVLLI